ncbi:hypothetical protein nepoznato_153 [Escherichia phage nepoznato]|uniref:Uncharacterized protein n=1 Tax=Escherichia phage nepoznato TaxID=2696431 RepID=A0A6B9WLL1_9CAUD|nr:hypothetical protein JR323_gp124 [Escherichia phage nepoznato]QHR65602.1 hypothetical protein nepoznato_153 [Escherichia phage nepoznato]
MINKGNSLTVGTINAILLAVPVWITVAIVVSIIL